MPNKTPQPDDTQPGISAVVCCHNSAGVVAPALRALASQRIPPGAGYEVILVDNACSDDTVQVATSAWGAAPHPLRIVAEPSPGLAIARRAGAAAARFAVVVFVDDDNRPAADFVERVLALFAAMPRVGLIGGYVEPVLESAAPWWFAAFQQVYACGPRDRRPGPGPQWLFGAGLAVRTAAARAALIDGPPLLLCGNSGRRLLRGEDTELVFRCRLLGWETYYDESIRVGHAVSRERLTWRHVCRTRRQGGRSHAVLELYLGLLKKGSPPSRLAQARKTLGKWRKIFVRHPSVLWRFNRAGDRGSFLFHFWVLGVPSGLWRLRKTYDRDAAAIARAYPPAPGGVRSPEGVPRRDR